MKVLLTGLVLFLSISNLVDGKKFRPDYTYSHSIGGWLKFHEIPASWYEARLRCHLEGAVLASPLNRSLKRAMLSSKKKWSLTYDALYTGIHATLSRGDYNSIEGVPLEKIPHRWYKDEPDNDGGNENCILMHANGDFSDVNCNELFQYTCYKKNISSSVEIDACGPLDNDYVFDAGTRHCYKFHNLGSTWSMANMVCFAEGGYLTIINDEAEATYLMNLFTDYPPEKIIGNVAQESKNVAFIGFHNWKQYGEWFTVHGQTLREAGYEAWDDHQPNVALNISQHCGGLFRTAKLGNIECNKPAPFICEKTAEGLVDDPLNLN